MSDMYRVILTANGTEELPVSNRRSLMIMLSNTLGGGTLNIKRYSQAVDAFVAIASYSAVTADAEEIKVGPSEIQLELTGATSPNLVIDYWWL